MGQQSSHQHPLDVLNSVIAQTVENIDKFKNVSYVTPTRKIVFKIGGKLNVFNQFNYVRNCKKSGGF